jgi:hypothetical protein
MRDQFTAHIEREEETKMYVGYPQEVDITDKSALEQIKMIQDLDEEDKQTILKMIKAF